MRNAVWLASDFLRVVLNVYTEEFGLQGPEAYAYTSVSNCLDVDGISDPHDFTETIVSPLPQLPDHPFTNVLERDASHWSQ